MEFAKQEFQELWGQIMGRPEQEFPEVGKADASGYHETHACLSGGILCLSMPK